MTVRLSVTYSATDGSMPENVEIVWEDEAPEPVLLSSIVESLVGAPRLNEWDRIKKAPGDSGLDIPCQRPGCGHAHNDHSSYDLSGNAPGGPNDGSCMTCTGCRAYARQQYRAAEDLVVGQKVNAVMGMVYPTGKGGHHDGVIIDNAPEGTALWFQYDGPERRIWRKA